MEEGDQLARSVHERLEPLLLLLIGEEHEAIIRVGETRESGGQTDDGLLDASADPALQPSVDADKGRSAVAPHGGP